MDWAEVKRLVRSDLMSRSLAQPQRRLNALDSLEVLLVDSYAGFEAGPEILLRFRKDEVSATLSRQKETGRLSGAESSVLNDVFRFLQESDPETDRRDVSEGGMGAHTTARADPPPKRQQRVQQSKYAEVQLDLDRPEYNDVIDRPVEEVIDEFRANDAGAYKLGLPPVIDQHSRILILGTMPGDDSLRQQNYYANSRNQFWPILSAVFDEPIGTLYDNRIEFLRRKGLALWDVLKSANRVGSLDSAIKSAEPNEFGELFGNHPNLRKIGFNGTKAEALFRRYMDPRLHLRGMAVASKVLPSTSPTPGRNILRLEEKIAKWREFLLSL